MRITAFCYEVYGFRFSIMKIEGVNINASDPETKSIDLQGDFYQ